MPIERLARLSCVCGACKWIDERNAERLKIFDFACNDRQASHERRGRDECVLEVVIGFSVRELRPTTQDRSVRGQNTITLRNRLEPILDFLCLGDILMPGDLYSRLYLTDCYRRNDASRKKASSVVRPLQGSWRCQKGHARQDQRTQLARMGKMAKLEPLG
jgi:hypothetical protein